MELDRDFIKSQACSLGREKEDGERNREKMKRDREREEKCKRENDLKCNRKSHLGMLVAVRSDDPGAPLSVPWRSGPGVGNNGDGRSLSGRVLDAGSGG